MHAENSVFQMASFEDLLLNEKQKKQLVSLNNEVTKASHLLPVFQIITIITCQAKHDPEQVLTDTNVVRSFLLFAILFAIYYVVAVHKQYAYVNKMVTSSLY